MTKERASAAAKAHADELIANLRDGKLALDKPVDGQAWKVTEAATRGQEGVEPAAYCRHCSAWPSLLQKTSRPLLT